MANKPNSKRSSVVNTRSGRSVVQTEEAPLTPIRLGLIDFVARYAHQNRCAPTYQEIANGTGLKSVASVHFHLNKLAQTGYVTLGAHRRSLRLTAAARKIARTEEGAA